MMYCKNYLIVMDFISRQFSVLSSATENRALSYRQRLQITFTPVNQSEHRAGPCDPERANQGTRLVLILLNGATVVFCYDFLCSLRSE